MPRRRRPTRETTETGLQLVDVGAAPNDGTGDPLRTAFMKLNNNVNFINQMMLATRMPTGFDRDAQPERLGILQYCRDASSGIVYQIDENSVYTVKTDQTYFADNTTPLADRTFAHYHAPSESKISFWVGGEYIEITEIKTLQLTDDVEARYIGYDDSGNLILPTSVTRAILNFALVTRIADNPDTNQNLWFADERHGVVMSVTTHLNLHRTRGFSWPVGLKDGGLDISGIVDKGTSFTEISGGYCYNEDIITEFASRTAIPTAYKTGADGRIVIDETETNKLAYFVDGACVYNLFNGSNWELAGIGNDFVIYTIWATNNKRFPIIRTPGQVLYPLASTARDHLGNDLYEYELSVKISSEMLPLFSYIINKESSGEIVAGENGEIFVDYKMSYPISVF